MESEYTSKNLDETRKALEALLIQMDERIGVEWVGPFPSPSTAEWFQQFLDLEQLFLSEKPNQPPWELVEQQQQLEGFKFYDSFRTSVSSIIGLPVPAVGLDGKKARLACIQEAWLSILAEGGLYAEIVGRKRHWRRIPRVR